MKISNPLQMNDWGIKKFLGVILAIHLVLWGITGLDALGVGFEALGVRLPFLAAFIGFVYLTFIPGLLILRVLRLHKLGSIRTLLLSVGLSIAFTMFIGLLINAIYPLVGILGPLSTIPLLITFSAITLILSVLSYIRDKDFFEPSYIEVRELLSSPALFLLLLPLLSILGAFMVRFYHTNTLLLVMMVVVAIVVALVASNRFIGKQYYPLAIFMIALALLYYRQLSFSHLFGTDIQVEYYVYNFTAVNAYWTATPMASNYGSMLSITILPTVYSYLLSMDGIGVFKSIYPFLVSLVPLGLYEVYQRQTSEKVAFLSSFFFMSFIFFLGGLTYVLRMQVAELFFILLIMLISSKEIALVNRVTLFIVFSFSLVVSHYGLAYYYIFYILVALLFAIFMKRLMNAGTKKELLTTTGVVLCLVATLSWYMYIANAVNLRGAVGMGQFIWSQLSDVLVLSARDPQLLQGLGLRAVGQVEHSVLREVAGWFNRIVTILIIIGVFRFLVKRREMRFAPEYIGLALAGLLTLVAALVIPGFSYAALNTARIYHIALFLLSPFCILGGEAVFAGIKRLLKRVNEKVAGDATWENRAHLYVTLLVLIPYFLLNIGFAFEVAGDHPTTDVLGMERVKAGANEETKAGLYNSYRPEQDVISIRWLSENRDETTPVYCDKSAIYFLLPGCSTIEPKYQETLYRVTEINEEAYIYLRYFNVTENLLVGMKPVRGLGYGKWMIIYDINKISPLLEKSSLVYSNGGSEIYYTGPE